MNKTIHRNSLLTAGIVLAAATAYQTAEASSIPVATFSQTAKVGTATNSSSNPGTVSEMIRNTSLDISADAFITAGADPSVEATISAQDLGSSKILLGPPSPA